MALGKPLLIGLPLLALGLAVIGYIAIRLFWRLYVLGNGTAATNIFAQ